MEILLNGLTFQSKLSQSGIYLLYLLKMLALDLPDYLIDGLDEVQSIDRKCHLYEPVCEQLRQDCLGGFHNRRYYRWLHQIIELLPHEAVKCQGAARENGRYCHVRTHRVYFFWLNASRDQLLIPSPLSIRLCNRVSIYSSY